jgi:hypothetical protein
MRRDIKYVVVERSRSGPRGKTRKYTTHRDIEDAPNVESLRCRYKDRRIPSDFLAPIEGFLRKSCGRPWDKVYSEIREHLNGNSTMQAHVLQHVHQYVEENAVITEGVPYDIQGHAITSYLSYPMFYVDGKGVLRKAPTQASTKYQKPVLPLIVFPNMRGVQYRMCNRGDGLRWYKLTLETAKEGSWDMFLLKRFTFSTGYLIGFSSPNERESLYGDPGLHCSRMEACGSKMIKRLEKINRL